MIRIDGTEVRAFADQLRDVPKELRRGLRKSIREASSDLVSTIRGNYGWSSRIPAAVKVRVGFGARSSGVTVYVDRGMAPHARPLEFGNRGAFNRHPVYGGPAWTDQPIRPSFMRAIPPAEPKVVAKVQGAIDQVFNRL